MAVEIDDYRQGDEERMAEIAPRAFGRFTRHGIDYTLPRDRVELHYRNEALSYGRRMAHQPDDLAVFVARRDGEVSGYIVVNIDHARSEEFGMRWGVLRSLAVDPDFHHQGIGTKLIERAMQWFREQRCEYIEVPTDQNNIAAIRAYEAAGFRVIYCGMVLSQKLEH